MKTRILTKDQYYKEHGTRQLIHVGLVYYPQVKYHWYSGWINLGRWFDANSNWIYENPIIVGYNDRNYAKGIIEQFLEENK